MPLGELSRDEVKTVEPETSVEEAARRMKDEGIGSLIVAEGGRPRGILTDRDITTRVVANGATSDGTRVRDVMTEDLRCADTDDGVFDATEMMGRNSIRRLPVLDEDGEIEGIVTADDLREMIAKEERQIADVIEDQRPAY